MRILRQGLPLFPLRTVLFPLMSLPLFIFEKRYVSMINRCIDEDLAFGVALIREGPEVGGTPIPYEVGTLARIAEVERLEGGKMNINTLGQNRFRILATHQDEPYLTADIEVLQDDMGDSTLLEACFLRAQPLFKNYSLAILELAGEQPVQDLTVTRDPKLLSYAIAATCQSDPREKQSLLEAPTVAQRLQREIQMLRREIEIVRREANARERLARESGLHYKN